MGEQSWSDAEVSHGRILVVTDNPISRAMVPLAGVLRRPLQVLADDRAVEELRTAGLTGDDAVVLCDHDTPGRDDLLRIALDAETRYVAMLGNRQRARRTYDELAVTCSEAALARLHVPAGLNIGGKSPAEIAFSVLAEIVADSYGRSGGPMRG